MKIIVAEKMSASAINLLREPGWTVVTPDQLNGNLPQELQDADALLVRSAVQVNAALLEKAGKLADCLTTNILRDRGKRHRRGSQHLLRVLDPQSDQIPIWRNSFGIAERSAKMAYARSNFRGKFFERPTLADVVSNKCLRASQLPRGQSFATVSPMSRFDPIPAADALNPAPAKYSLNKDPRSYSIKPAISPNGHRIARVKGGVLEVLQVN